jgi:disulfide bond formation protein DsbB
MQFKRYLSDPRLQAAMIAEIGFWPLLGALVAQYGFAYAPCELCLFQRYPYAAMFLLAGFALYKPERSRIMLDIAGGLCLISAAIGLFHTGVESGWWVYESGCIPEIGQAGSLDTLRDSIAKAPIVACDQAMLYLFGLSMAAWNVAYGLLGALSFMWVRRLLRS